MMNRHHKMIEDLDGHIAKINRDKEELQKEFLEMKQNLLLERDSLLNELNKRRENHDKIVEETLNNIEKSKLDIENLNIINNDTLQEKLQNENLL